MMSEWSGRFRQYLGENTEYVLAGLFVLTLVGGFVTYNTYLDPGTEIEQVEESSWSSTAEFTHEATVINETDVFAEGETLANRSVYLKSITPELNGTFQYRYQATEGGELSATVDLRLVLRSVSEETEFWREERTVTTATAQSLEPGEEMSVPFSFNITELNARAEEIEAQLEGTPGEIEMTVSAALAVTGERNGQEIEETSNHEMAIVDQSQTYRIDGASAETDGGRQFAQETVPVNYGSLRSVGGPTLLFIAVFGLAGVGAGRITGQLEVSETQREWTAYRSELREFEEWITRGTVPETATEKEQIRVDSLEGLVDVAIDSNRRVISDQSRNVYVVLLEEAVYRYDPPDPPSDGDEPLVPGESTAGDGSVTANENGSAGDSDGSTEPDE